MLIICVGKTLLAVICSHREEVPFWIAGHQCLNILPFLQPLLLLLYSNSASFFLVCFTVRPCWKSFSLCCYISVVLFIICSTQMLPHISQQFEKFFCLGTELTLFKLMCTKDILRHWNTPFTFMFSAHKDFPFLKARIKPTCNKVRWHR